MTFKVVKKEYVEVDVPQADVIKGTISILIGKLKEKNHGLYNYYCFFLKEDRFWGREELVSSHRSDEDTDITDILTEDQKELIRVILYLQHPPFELKYV